MTVKIPMNDHLKGYKYYQAVYLGDPLERFDAVVEGDFLVFETYPSEPVCYPWF